MSNLSIDNYIYFVMNTPKYGVNLRQNTLGSSPIRNRTTGKYFSGEEVNKIMKATFQPKIQFLMQELEDRQQIIARLNNKLNENDEKLIQQRTLLDNYTKKHRDSSQLQSYIISTINQLINDKIKQCWETITSQIKHIGSKMQTDLNYKRIETVIQEEMQRLKGSVNEFIENNKKKSNSYWQKIKDTLNKLNSKIVATEKDILDMNVKLQGFQHQRASDRETINELQTSKSVVKNFIQLRKSVQNIYSNYQAILTLQKGLKQKIEEQHTDFLWHQPGVSKPSSNMILSNQQMALEYSKEEALPSIGKQMHDGWKTFDNVGHPVVSPIKSSENNKSNSDIFQLQKTTPLIGNQEASQMFSLNASHQMNSKIHNSTVLLNYSLQTRKEMSQGIRQRLLELIEAKNLYRPLEVRYDEQINYLKSAQGNYLFDMKGNMFKITPNDLVKLEEERIIAQQKSRKISLSNSKIKRTNC